MAYRVIETQGMNDYISLKSDDALTLQDIKKFLNDFDSPRVTFFGKYDVTVRLTKIELIKGDDE